MFTTDAGMATAPAPTAPATGPDAAGRWARGMQPENGRAAGMPLPPKEQAHRPHLKMFRPEEAEQAGAVRAVYLEGVSYADLAAREGLPINTVRSWLRRSLLRLKDCVSQ